MYIQELSPSLGLGGNVQVEQEEGAEFDILGHVACGI